MLGWLFGSKNRKPRGDIVIWKTGQRKWRALLERLAAARASDRAVVLVVHFDESLRLFEGLAAEIGIPWRPLESIRSGSIELATPDVESTIYLMHSRLLVGWPPVAPDDSGVDRVAFFVSEPYCVPARDVAVEQFAESLPFQTTVECHAALDDTILRCFVSSGVVEMLERMGMDDDTPIEGGMVAGAVRNAQQRIEKAATGDVAADSAEEWLRVNCPQKYAEFGDR